MLFAGLGIMVLALLVGGGLYGYRDFLRSKPAPIWVPLPLRADISMAEQEKMAKEIDTRLRTDEILRQIAIDVDLQKKLKQPSLNAAVKELDRRLFVKPGSADTPSGTVPSINIGVNGNGHEKEVLGETATRIIKDVWKILGIDPVTGQPINQPGTALGVPAENY